MSKYLKHFDDYNQYSEFGDSQDVLLPNVSYCEHEQQVFYNMDSEQKYKYQYFTTISRAANNVISFIMGENSDENKLEYISYSLDDGKTWTTVPNVDEETVTVDVEIGRNKRILWKGNGVSIRYCHFSSVGKFDVSGNVMSLIAGDKFIGKTLSYSYQFQMLFASSDDNPCKVTDASTLYLPCTNLTAHCYEYMFYHCEYLETAPKLPALKLAEYCYSNMFNGCISLEEAPELPALKLENYCYNYMFHGCENLIYIKAMFTTTPNNTYTEAWVYGVHGNKFNFSTGTYEDDCDVCGTFVKNKSASWNVRGDNGIPNRWAVVTE